MNSNRKQPQSQDNAFVVKFRRNTANNPQSNLNNRALSHGQTNGRRKTSKGARIINQGIKYLNRSKSRPQTQTQTPISKNSTRTLKQRFLASKNKNLKFLDNGDNDDDVNIAGKKIFKNIKKIQKTINSSKKNKDQAYSKISPGDKNSILKGSVKQNYDFPKEKKDLRTSTASYTNFKRGEIVRGKMKINKKIQQDSENQKVLWDIEAHRTRGDKIWNQIQGEFHKMGILDNTLYQEIMESSDRMIVDKEGAQSDNDEEEDSDSDELEMPEVMNLENEIQKLRSYIAKLSENMERKTKNIRILKVN